ncbi:MAG: FHA domain-containing protein [Pirellulales bacterium]|nr:FHA domain-containing protein [Pirellulales bacterium]
MIRWANTWWGLRSMDGASPTDSGRFLLWIDAVGGFWVCLGDAVVLGQPVPAAAADVPILGDLSSRHARIVRDGEGYVIEALRDVRVDGKRVTGAAGLRDGNVIQLGEGVRLRFRRPHALSATARLDFVSRHRTQPSADAIILMADAFVLGPKPQSHVVCRKWRDELILYRQEDRLFFRAPGTFEIDGKEHRDRGPITRNSRIAGDRFALCLESL